MFSSPQVLTLAEQIAIQIKFAILDGNIKPGLQLPGEFDLATFFGVSRPTIRQALDILCYEKILDVRRGRGGGHFVVPRITGDNYESFKKLLPKDLKKIDKNELIEARNTIQLRSFELARQCYTPEDLQKLKSLIPRDERDDFVWKILEFQTYLTQISHNQFLISNQIPLTRTMRAIFLQIDIPNSIQACYIKNLENVYKCLTKNNSSTDCMNYCLEQCNKFIGEYLNKE